MVEGDLMGGAFRSCIRFQRNFSAEGLKGLDVHGLSAGSRKLVPSKGVDGWLWIVNVELG